MSTEIKLAALEYRMAFVGANFAGASDYAGRQRMAVDLVGLRSEIGFFLDRHGTDVSDDVWVNLMTTMHEIDGTIRALGPITVGMA
jgi:hypothetical protein